MSIVLARHYILMVSYHYALENEKMINSKATDKLAVNKWVVALPYKSYEVNYWKHCTIYRS